jgi:hypothetical protein
VGVKQIRHEDDYLLCKMPESRIRGASFPCPQYAFSAACFIYIAVYDFHYLKAAKEKIVSQKVFDV